MGVLGESWVGSALGSPRLELFLGILGHCHLIVVDDFARVWINVEDGFGFEAEVAVILGTHGMVLLLLVATVRVFNDSGLSTSKYGTSGNLQVSHKHVPTLTK
ncbi:hypothetical protein [Pseudomonas coronafaciens]|uniref:hypothetical protein n=1 Tax=Pseudomonas coronafaciens TaxID=53409 RepID=UPI001680A8E2|nr:hypothetical protein [Pseudomonas coronafaciens]